MRRRQIDDALGDMIHLGVRAMLVMREQRIVGLITSYDIQGERPLQFLQTSNYSRHQDIRVGHIMTPWDKLLSVDWESIQAARAGDLLHVLEEAGLTHLLVIERGEQERHAHRARHGVARAAYSAAARVAARRLGLEPDDGGDAGEGHQQGAGQMSRHGAQGPQGAARLQQDHDLGGETSRMWSSRRKIRWSRTAAIPARRPDRW